MTEIGGRRPGLWLRFLIVVEIFGIGTNLDALWTRSDPHALRFILYPNRRWCHGGIDFLSSDFYGYRSPVEFSLPFQAPARKQGTRCYKMSSAASPTCSAAQYQESAVIVCQGSTATSIAASWFSCLFGLNVVLATGLIVLFKLPARWENAAVAIDYRLGLCLHTAIAVGTSAAIIYIQTLIVELDRSPGRVAGCTWAFWYFVTEAAVILALLGIGSFAYASRSLSLYIARGLPSRGRLSPDVDK